MAISIPASIEDEAAALLMELGARGVSVDTSAPGLPAPDPVRLRAWFDPPASPPDPDSIERRLAPLAAGLSPARVLSVTGVEDGRWVEAWVAALAPFPVGERFVVTPVEDLDEAPPRMNLFICPSRAFGTGEHPTTRMCLEEIERCRPAGRAVLDAGTGSGILAIAATLLGARFVAGYDNDPEAIEVAVKNARLNGAAGKIRFVLGDTASIDDPCFDIVVANLNGTILTGAIPELASRLAAGGALILSGILPGEIAAISAVAAAAGLGVEREIVRDGWACLVCGSRRA